MGLCACTNVSTARMAESECLGPAVRLPVATGEVVSASAA